MAYTTINKSSDYFNTKLYTGNGSTNAITGVDFQPDFVWIKNRDDVHGHQLYDVIRGVTKRLSSNNTGAEATDSTGLTSFDSDGFTVGSETAVNANTENIVAWNWLGANGTASNTDGSITSTVSANTTSGFSIVSYTGTGSAGTIGHGLNAVPKMIISKSLANGEHWGTYHASLGNGKVIALNSTDGSITNSAYWNNTSPTTSVWSVGTSPLTNHPHASIAYCFAEKKGFSKFGSYTGNGSTDGTFVYTGFKPSFILSKRTDVSGQNWTIWDNKRSSSNFNPTDKILHPNVSNTENTADDTDFLSNGFKLRATALGMNASGSSYIYMAFAEVPLVGSNGVTAKAR
jgi:hypothetical protein